MAKYLSIITKFGCHNECPYCIVKENNLHIPKTTIAGLENLKRTILGNECDWVSLSGGGDPLFHYNENKTWFEHFFEVIPKGVKTELHTSIIGNYEMVAPFDRIVYHLRNISDIQNLSRYNGQIVRVVFVVTKDFTEEKINTIVNLVKFNNNIDELSFRQMVDENYETTHYCERYLKKGHKKHWYYIQQGDYNLYYCEGRVSTVYKDFEKQENKNERVSANSLHI